MTDADKYSVCLMCDGEDCDSADDLHKLCKECYDMVTWPKELDQ